MFIKIGDPQPIQAVYADMPEEVSKEAAEKLEAVKEELSKEDSKQDDNV